MEEWLEQVGSKVSDQVTDHVCDNDARSRKLDAQLLFEAYEKHHRHSEDGEKELVFYAGHAARYRHSRMQESEYMNYQRDVDIPHKISSQTKH